MRRFIVVAAFRVESNDAEQADAVLDMLTDLPSVYIEQTVDAAKEEGEATPEVACNLLHAGWTEEDE